MTLTEAFQRQALSCSRLGSPFMERLLLILSKHWPQGTDLARRCARFTGDIGPAGASLPLRIAGGLHALVLNGRAKELAKVYPPHDVTDDELRRSVLMALDGHAPFLLDWIESAPQTNEVRRSAALMAGAAVVRQHHDLPVCLSELGASGGLNLMWDHFALCLPGVRLGPHPAALELTPEWHGPMPPAVLPCIADRAGVDLSSLNPARVADMLRLTAFLWPDQPDRLALTRAAAQVMTAPIIRADAIEWLEQRLNNAPDGHTHMVQHSVAWQYFPRELQARGRALMEAAGARATASRPLAWLSLETDGDTTAERGAALTLRLWPGDIRLHLGRADFHGRWVRWQGGA